MTSNVFTPFSLRGMTVPNRLVMSPMLMYAAADEGLLNDFLFVHYGARALGGVGMIATEVLAVEPRGRISARDLGSWTDAQGVELQRLVRFVQFERLNHEQCRTKSRRSRAHLRYPQQIRLGL